MTAAVHARISQSALHHNYQQVKLMANDRKILAMIKANAYGHSMPLVAKTLAPDAWGVARLEEAIALQTHHAPSCPIVLMEGAFSAADCQTAIAAGFHLVIHMPTQWDDLIAQPTEQPIYIWFKINTGMNRLGLSPSHLKTLWASLKRHPNIHLQGFMTHLATADTLVHPMAAEQLSSFDALLQDKPGPKSAANSAALIQYPQSCYDWVRPGIMLYGASPIPNKTGQSHGLKPVMQLVTRIIALHDLPAGAAVGYGATFVAKRPTKLAIAAIGYGDGYPLSASAKTPILVEGHQATLAGKVSMDMLAIDVSHIPNVTIGDKVECWGPNLPVEVVANSCHASPYQLLTQLTQRVQYQLID